jgi:hypothetical protein
MASRPRCDRPCRPAAIFFAAETRIRQDQAELRVNIRLMFHAMVTRLRRAAPGRDGSIIGDGAATGAAVTGAGAAVIGAGAVVTGAAAIGAAVTGEVTQAATLFEDGSFEQSGVLVAECTPTNNPGFDFCGNVPGRPGISCLDLKAASARSPTLRPFHLEASFYRKNAYTTGARFQ